MSVHDYLKRSVWYLDSGCSRHMTRVKQYLHIYSKEPGPKVVFGNDSLGDTKGYGSANCSVYKDLGNHNQNDEVVVIALRRRDVYIIDMSSFNKESNAYFLAKASPRLVRKGKHHRASFKTKRSFSINKSLHLLHMDLFGPVKPQTISHNKYTLIIVDEYSRYTWVFCLKKKSEAADCIMSFIKKMENLNEVRVKELRSDNKTEFRNHKLEELCDEKGISQNFSSPCTREQNGVARRRNRTLIKAARTMLNSAKLPKQFWGEAVNTACYTQNRSIIVKRHGKTAYDVFRGRSPNISYFYMFGCHVHIHNYRDHLGKFDENADDGFFLGYSLVAKAFRYFPYVSAYENITSTILPTLQNSVTAEEPPEFTLANDHLSIHEPDHVESTDILESFEPQDTVLSESISDDQPDPIILPSTKVIPQNLVPQDRWSREKHIDLA
ncbi:retrovirus-related pol polyprotein from transposon TNT 1-94, partial [Tanacetum coccineum]